MIAVAPAKIRERGLAPTWIQGPSSIRERGLPPTGIYELQLFVGG